MPDVMYKVIVKIANTKGHKVWRHFCYAPLALVLKYERDTDKRLSESILEWVQKDFDITMDDSKTMRKAKDQIKAAYRDKYPNIYLESDTDNQGWARVWLVEKIKEELGDE